MQYSLPILGNAKRLKSFRYTVMYFDPIYNADDLIISLQRHYLCPNTGKCQDKVANYVII